LSYVPGTRFAAISNLKSEISDYLNGPG